MGEIIFVDPQPREAGIALDDAEAPLERLCPDEAQQIRMIAFGNHDQRAALDELFVDGANAVPTPGLHPFAHRIIQHDRDIGRIDVQFRARFGFQFFFLEIVGDKRKVLARNPVAFW